MDVKTFPQALRICRKLREWSQEQVGTEVGASQQAVASWESRRSSPRPETYSKLVEVFGPDSLVAKCPPREDDLLVPRSERFGYTTPETVRFSVPIFSTSSVRGDTVQYRIGEPPADVHGSLQGTAEMRLLHSKLQSALPESQAACVGVHVHYRGHNYTAAYLSPKLCVIVTHYKIPTFLAEREAGVARNHLRLSVRRAAQEAVRQSVIVRAIIARDNAAPRTYVAIATPTGGAVGMDGLISSQVDDEAHLLGVRCHHAMTPQMIAAIIDNYESPEIDLFQGESEV